MLVKVSVENFKSFDKAAELTMISSNKIRTNANHRLKIKSTQLLKYAVVYGANASGKTNLALFFKFFKDSVCNGIPIEATQMFCKNRQENKERESSFEIQITVGDKFYAYGFSAVLSRRKVTGEWLYELYQNGSAKCLFEREGSKRPVLNESITLTNTEKNKFETYADDFEGNETSLFLTEMNRGKKYSTRSKLLFFRDVYDWIQNHISIITPDTPLIDLEYYYDDNSLKLINKLIKTFDTGISQVKIEGVLHEFSSIPGVKEDVTEIIMNLKSLAIKNTSESNDPKIAYIEFEGEGVVRASDIQVDQDIEIMNPNQVIATLNGGPDSKLYMELTITKGRGYVSADKGKTDDMPIGVLAVDAIYTPVERVNLTVQNTRVGQITDYDKLTLDVYTKGTLDPDEAVSLAAKVLSEHLKLFIDLSENAKTAEVMIEKEDNEKEKVLEMSIDELELSVRSYNCLKRAGINTVEELTNKTPEDMMKVRNLGRKSLEEVLAKLKELNLELNHGEE